MDDFIKPLLGAMTPPWNYVAGVTALLFMIVPRFTALRHDLFDLQMGRRRLELEKLRLEVLKLQAELRQLPLSPDLRAQLESADRRAGEVHVQLESKAMPAAAAPAPAARRPAERPPGAIGRWLHRNAWIGRPVLFLAQALLAILMALFAITVIGLPMAFFSSEDLDAGGSAGFAFAFLLYVVFLWLAWRGFARVRSLRGGFAAA
jgi:hypothetical protein